MSQQRMEIKVTGIVQGVGFRPYIYALAKEKDLKGFVYNTSEGVFIEVEGLRQDILSFIRDLPLKAPSLAKIENIDLKELSLKGDKEFYIKESVEKENKYTLISPDIATCRECLVDINSPSNRRYNYPFTNCTNCGPRFTIIRNIPYDRANTTMAEFNMCPDCYKEYHEPTNRRFHAQPNACFVCGPELKLLNSGGSVLTESNVVSRAVELLKKGYILAIKGIGGYHLACNALDEEAVKNLRSRKIREDKPFAIMVKDIQTVKKYCCLDAEEEEKLLQSPRAPIVLLKKKADVPLASQVSPANPYLGVMLPYTPLHHIIFREIDVLVMTSGNISDEPIAYNDEDALSRLKGIADYFLVHDRAIHRRCDDSVTRVFEGREFIIRRSRGYAPDPLMLNRDLGEVLACGGEQKNTFALSKGNKVFISHHIGDLENLETLISFEEGINDYKKLFKINPKIIAHDLHPEYLSTKYALEQNLPKVGIQHHHAHIASCMAENNITGQVIGISFDGTGYGTDGTLWGGEFLVCDYKEFFRVGHLRTVPMPGGSAAIKEPWRMAASYLDMSSGYRWGGILPREWEEKWPLMRQAVEKGINSPLTSSMGRLFDGVASILGVKNKVNYEGQAAVELELLALAAIEPLSGLFEFDYLSSDDKIIIDWIPVINEILNDIKRGRNKEQIALKFHHSVAFMITDVCNKIRVQKGINRVCLSGGVFQNILLLEATLNRLRKNKFETYIHHLVPTNDGGISLGQIVIANERRESACV